MLWCRAAKLPGLLRGRGWSLLPAAPVASPACMPVLAGSHNMRAACRGARHGSTLQRDAVPVPVACTCGLYLWPVPVACTCGLYLWPHANGTRLVACTCGLHQWPVLISSATSRAVTGTGALPQASCRAVLAARHCEAWACCRWYLGQPDRMQ
jgi:hypothetical protein